MTTALVPGSVGALAREQHTSLAEVFTNVDTIILVDVSSSMGDCDARGGKQRWTVANEELQALQAALPGKLAVVAFSSTTTFCPGGILPKPSGGTELTEALEYVQIADGACDFIVISDGEPNNERTALALAATFESTISTVYVGADGDTQAMAFLRRLAAASGGKSVTAAQAANLSARLKPLLTA